MVLRVKKGPVPLRDLCPPRRMSPREAKNTDSSTISSVTFSLSSSFYGDISPFFCLAESYGPVSRIDVCSGTGGGKGPSRQREWYAP